MTVTPDSITTTTQVRAPRRPAPAPAALPTRVGYVVGRTSVWEQALARRSG